MWDELVAALVKFGGTDPERLATHANHKLCFLMEALINKRSKAETGFIYSVPLSVWALGEDS